MPPPRDGGHLRKEMYEALLTYSTGIRSPPGNQSALEAVRRTTNRSPEHPFVFLFQDIVGGRVHEFQVHRPNKAPASYQLKIGDEAVHAPMVRA